MDEDDFIIREGRADKPIGTTPNPIIRKALENLYISIVGALDVGDFSTFLKEVSNLSYEEAKDKMVREYGSPTQLSEAKLKAKSSEAASRLEIAEQESASEQRTLEDEFAELEGIARKRLGENFELSRRNQELENDLKRLKEELAKLKAPLLPGAPPAPAPSVPAGHGSMYNEYMRRINEVITIHNINDLASEIFDIAEREEYYKLTKTDIAELMNDLRKISERRAIKLAEMRLPEKKAKIIRVLPEKRPPEEIPPSGTEKEFRPVVFEIKTLNSMNAKLFFEMYKKYLKEMLFSGIENWLNVHPEAYKFPVTSYNIRVMADSLRYIFKIPSQNIRNIMAYEFLRDYIELILLYGIDASFEQYSDELKTKHNYYTNVLRLKDVPGIEAFQKDVYNSIISII